jgi:hypothetical protein
MLLVASREASAQPETRRFELTPYAGYRFGGEFEAQDSSVSVKLVDAASAGLIFNMRESANTQWEAVYSRQKSSVDTSVPAPSTDVQMEVLQGGGTYEFNARAGHPYLAATLGGTRISPRVPGLNGDTFWSMSLGVGLQLPLGERLGLRLEARAWGTLIDSDTDLFCQSGSGGATCAIEIDGHVLWQLEAFAGLAFRF